MGIVKRKSTYTMYKEILLPDGSIIVDRKKDDLNNWHDSPKIRKMDKIADEIRDILDDENLDSGDKNYFLNTLQAIVNFRI